jgi:hypothetical protein
MITDISYLEAGFSEEFSSLLNGNSDNEVENLNEGMFSKFKSLFEKSNGRKSNYKSKRYDTHRKSRTLTEEEIENRQKIFDAIKSRIKESDIKKILNKHPMVAPMFTFNIDPNIFLEYSDGEDCIYIISINYWDHPEAKSKGRAFYTENNDMWEEHSKCVDDLMLYLKSEPTQQQAKVQL